MSRHPSLPLVLSALLATGCSAPGLPPELEPIVDRLCREIPQRLVTHSVPGLSMVLIRDRRIVWRGVFGQRRAGEAAASPAGTTAATVTPDTVFEACSLSKPLFAYAALKLVDQGRLDLDRPLDDYLPAPYLPDLKQTRTITGRMVLTHITGLPNWRRGGWRRGGPLHLKFEPGSRFGYSGEGFTFLQRVIEHLTGEDLAAFMTSRLLAPLGMRRSGYVWRDDLANDFAAGHDAGGTVKSKRRFFDRPNAAFTLYTTPQDYARFLIEMLAPDHGRPRTLSPRLRREMLTLQRVPGMRGEKQRRGLGWVLASREAGGYVHHSGANGTGFRCYCRFHVDRGDGLVIMTNGINGAALWREVVALVNR